MNASRGRLAASIALACCAAGAHANTRYHLVDLGAGTSATAVASNGKVLGTQAGVAAVYDPVSAVWQPIALHTTGSDQANAINAAGAVAGLWIYKNAADVAEAWKPSKAAKLLYPKDPDTNSFANGIADDGTVVGGECPRSTQYACSVFTSKAGVTTVVGAPSGLYAVGIAVNLAGQIAANARFDASSQAQHAFRYDAGAWIDAGTLGGETSRTYAINARGTIVGCSDTSKASVQHAFMYAQKLKDLGTLAGGSSCATGIADDGTVVGSAAGNAPGTYVAFVWSQGTMSPLSQITDAPAGWDLGSEPRIGGDGTIVGSGTFEGVPHAYSLTPVAP